MNEASRRFEREFERLSAAFVEDLPFRVQSVGDAVTAWLAAPDEEALFERLSHKVHQLKGAGGDDEGAVGGSDVERRVRGTSREMHDLVAPVRKPLRGGFNGAKIPDFFWNLENFSRVLSAAVHFQIQLWNWTFHIFSPFSNSRVGFGTALEPTPSYMQLLLKFLRAQHVLTKHKPNEL